MITVILLFFVGAVGIVALWLVGEWLCCEAYNQGLADGKVVGAADERGRARQEALAAQAETQGDA